MTSTPSATPQAVMGHVQKLSDADPDFRFMSLNDLLQLLTNAKTDFLHHDYNIAARTVDSIIKTLDDQNGEVQNLAIKWLVPAEHVLQATSFTNYRHQPRPSCRQSSYSYHCSYD